MARTKNKFFEQTQMNPSKMNMKNARQIILKQPAHMAHMKHSAKH